MVDALNKVHHDHEDQDKADEHRRVKEPIEPLSPLLLKQCLRLFLNERARIVVNLELGVLCESTLLESLEKFLKHNNDNIRKS